MPFIHDGQFRLAESVAIVRYVSTKHSLDNNWYPKNPQEQAQVDEYLEWQHHNTRAFCAMYFQKKVRCVTKTNFGDFISFLVANSHSYWQTHGPRPTAKVRRQHGQLFAHR